ncbi:T9SS type A sorting domain-containing protein [Hymenobacter sp. BT664]|uniref:T9SS type A sorting domain-containing protein n=1 Tax=Hymenobacter montanus TaxID=2771359 RepID=A0A927GI72_9BACT|nr:T9SS type A sorting domain-containing protein [Hymenobacter montanus]MBD2766766.1 T9SS type A sorting domain-containing protein [Hymenobacter montanus]
MKRLFPLLVFSIAVTTMALGQSTSSIRSDGTILVNGQPFFPFGAYSIPYTEPRASQIQALSDMIAAGFNISTVADDGTPGAREAINNLLRIADSDHFKILISVTNGSVSNDPTILYAPQKYKTYPATFGYILTDDSDNGTYPLDYLAQLQAGVKSYDDSHLTFLTLTGWNTSCRNQANAYTAIADASGYQCYPIGFHRYSDWTAGTALTQTYLRTLGYVQSAALVNRPMIMHLQTFNWGDLSNTPRYPTVSELRNMLYSGLAAGIKGVISYDFSFDLKDNQPALWNEFKALRTDVATLEGALMNGALTRVNTGDQQLIASYWTDNTACYVVVVNTSYSNAKTVSLAIPSGYGGPITSLFSRMPATLSLSGNTLSGTLLPQAVQVYQLTGPVVLGTIAAREKQASQALPVHPNPATQAVSIDLAGFESEAVVQVHMRDMAGKLFTSQSVQLTPRVKTVTLPVHDLPQGLFLVTVQGRKTAKTAKLVITK